MEFTTNPVDTFSGSFHESTFELDGFVVEKLPGCGVAAVAAGQTVVMINKGTDGVDFEQLFLGQEVHCLFVRKSKRVIHAHQRERTLEMSDTRKSNAGPV